MKKFFSLFIALLFVAGISYSQKGGGASPAVIKWDSQSMDFGNVIKGSGISKEFIFINSGTVPLHISEATTKVEGLDIVFSKNEVAAGEQGNVTIKMTADVSGVFNHDINVVANTNPTGHILKIKGNVVKATSSGSSK